MNSAPAQKFLAIDTIREDTLVLHNGTLRVILMCSSLNFALKSEDEQDAIIYQYQNFLNSLDFSIQFVIHSRRMNIAPYIDSLRERLKEEDNELLKIQTNEYIEFVKTFADISNIMSKTFYVVVPFTPIMTDNKGGIFQTILSAVLPKKNEKNMDDENFEHEKNQLWQRVDAVIAGLRRFGVRSAPLNTEELIELFYGLYNPTEFEEVNRQGKADELETGGN